MTNISFLSAFETTSYLINLDVLEGTGGYIEKLDAICDSGSPFDAFIGAASMEQNERIPKEPDVLDEAEDPCPALVSPDLFDAAIHLKHFLVSSEFYDCPSPLAHCYRGLVPAAPYGSAPRHVIYCTW